MCCKFYKINFEIDMEISFHLFEDFILREGENYFTPDSKTNKNKNLSVSAEDNFTLYKLYI